MIRFVVSLMILLLLSAQFVHAVDRIDYGDYIHIDESPEWRSTEDANSICVEGQYAYVADGRYELKIYEIGDFESPELVATVRLPGADDVAVSGDYAYVVGHYSYDGYNSGTRGVLTILDISDPSEPVLVGQDESDRYYRNIVVEPGIVMMACGSWYYESEFYGIVSYDVSDPTAPVLNGLLNTGSEACDVVIQDRYAYVVDDQTGLLILDLWSDDTLEVVGTRDCPSNGNNIGVSGPWVYVSGRGDGVSTTTGFHVYDATIPGSPVMVGETSIWRGSNGLETDGSFAYVTQGTNGLQAIDVSDPRNPVVVGRVNPREQCRSPQLVGDRLLIATEYFGVRMTDVSNPCSPPCVGISTEVTGGSLLAAYRDRVYVGGSRLHVVDVADPGDPRLLSTLPYPNSLLNTGLDVSGEYVYLNDGYGIGAYRILESGDLLLVGPRLLSGSARWFKIHGRYGYFSPFTTVPSIRVFAADPYGLYFIDEFSVPGIPTGFEFDGDYCYMVAGEDCSFHVLDFEDPVRPVVLASIGLPGQGRRFTIQEDHAYVGAGNGLCVIDISDPESPTIVSETDLPAQLVGIAVHEDAAYIACSYAGLHVLDISNPESPEYVGSFNQQSYTDVVVYNDLVYVAGLGVPLYILPLQLGTNTGIEDRDDADDDSVPPLADHSFTIHPNPFNPSTTLSLSTARPQHLSIRIFDAKGALVNVLANGDYAPGHHAWTWEGRDEQGRQMPSGAYFAQLLSDEGKTSHKMVLVR
jgi:hypothetical protein